jgi:hypothetical protein
MGKIDVNLSCFDKIPPVKSEQASAERTKSKTALSKICR